VGHIDWNRNKRELKYKFIADFDFALKEDASEVRFNLFAQPQGYPFMQTARSS
jgi:hypothetical protein